MATLAPQLHPASATSRSPSVVNNHAGNRVSSTGSISDVHHDALSPESPSTMPSAAHLTATAATKKTKAKKAADPSETSKLLAAKISQLESDKAGEKDQDAEIGGSRRLLGSKLYIC